MNLAPGQLPESSTFAIAATIALAIVAIAIGAVSAQDNRPDAPANLTATGGDEAGTINVSWDAHSQTVEDYRLLGQGRRSSGPTPTPNGTPTSPATHIQSPAWTPVLSTSSR